jgi:hypothetical protein
MDLKEPGNQQLTTLSDCVAPEMSAREAAQAMRECWDRAERHLAPIMGREGLSIMFRRGEHVASRNLAMHSPPGTDHSITSLCEWVESLPQPDAVVVAKAFLVSVEGYLVSLLGIEGTRRMLGRA